MKGYLVGVLSMSEGSVIVKQSVLERNYQSVFSLHALKTPLSAQFVLGWSEV